MAQYSYEKSSLTFYYQCRAEQLFRCKQTFRQALKIRFSVCSELNHCLLIIFNRPFICNSNTRKRQTINRGYLHLKIEWYSIAEDWAQQECSTLVR